MEDVDLVLGALGRRHDVLAPTLAGHAGGPAFDEALGHAGIVDAVERAMDDAGFEAAHLVGNSLGGYVALRLAARGRAMSVVALAPAGGWVEDDDFYPAITRRQAEMHRGLQGAALTAEALVSRVAGRRSVTESTTVAFEHILAEFLAHQVRGVAACDALAMIDCDATGCRPPIVELDDVGHAPQLDVPLEAAHLILDFTSR